MRRGLSGSAAIVAAVTVVVMAVVVGATTARPVSAGGGSVLVPDRDHYEPGGPVHLTAQVRKYDRDWFGPYTVSLRPLTATGSLAEPGEDPTDTVVGRLVVTRLDPTFVRAEVTFVLPKLADGEYWVQHCNPGCTKNLGDLAPGVLRVGPLPAVAPTTVAPTTAAPTTRVVIPVDAPPTSIATTEVVPATATTAPTDLVVAVAAEDEAGVRLPVAVAGGGVAVLVLVLAIGVLARRRGPRRVVTGRGLLDGGDPPGDVVVVDLEPAPPRAGSGADASSTIGSAR